MTEDSSSTDTGRRGKVERLVDEYDLADVAERLERKRRGERGGPSSLRDLTAFFNREMLARRLTDVNSTVLDGETDNLYRLLTDDEVSGGERIRTRSRLEREGIDVDELERDFVSREAIRSYLDRRGVSRPDNDDTDRVEREQESIARLRSRTETVTADKLEQLRDAERISVGEFGVLVDVEVYCRECNTALTVDELLEERSCACAD